MKQIICVWFPFWPVQRQLRAQLELRKQIVVLHSPRESRSPRVVLGNRRALRLGVQPGMPLAEARSLIPQGVFLEHDPVGDKEALRELAWECHRYTPRAGLDETEEPDSLFLDVTGCSHLFDDLHGLCLAVARDFRHRGYWVQGACAPTWGAAWGLARHPRGPIRKRDRTPGQTPIPVEERFRPGVRQAEPRHNRQGKGTPERLFELVAPEELRSRLATLPVSALRLSPDTLSTLSECGLRTVSQLLELPRSSLPSRFGPQLLQRLDQATGAIDELLSPEVPPQPIVARMRWDCPIHDSASIEVVLHQLLEQALAELHIRRKATQELRVTWQIETGEAEPLTIRLLRPTHASDRLAELLSLRLERVPLVGGVIAIALEVVPCPLPLARRNTLFEQTDTGEVEFSHLVERLSQRLGETAVVRSHVQPEAQPEFTASRVPWLSLNPDAKRDRLHRSPARIKTPQPASPSGAVSTAVMAMRPLRLLSPPEPIAVDRGSTCPPTRFRWRGHEYHVVSCSNAERIVTGWWREQSIQRDYYRVEVDSGARFWMFCDLKSQRWSVHGVYE